MKIKNPDCKRLIVDIISFTDDVNEKGERIRRQSFKKGLLRGVLEVKESIKDSIEFAVKTDDEQEIKWIKASELTEEIQGAIVGERYLDTEVELSDKAIKAIKYYYEEREELIECSEGGLDELEKIISN